MMFRVSQDFYSHEYVHVYVQCHLLKPMGTNDFWEGSGDGT